MPVTPTPARPAVRRLRRAIAAASAVTGAAALAVTAPAPASAAACTEVHVVAARGTAEDGYLGRIVGDPVFAALRNRLPGRSVSSYRVNYPANLAFNSATTGNRDLVAHVQGQAAACPGQRFVLVGYSQGANVVGNALGTSSFGALVGGPVVATLSSSVQQRVAAVLLFGYPNRDLGRSVDSTYAGRTLDICYFGDPICGPGINMLAHLAYHRSAGQAADFARARL